MNDRRIDLPSVPNFRDLGGLPVLGGAFARGELYRSTDLSRLTDTDLPKYRKLGVQTVFDLRTAGERTAAPDRLDDDQRAVVLDVLADSRHAAAASLSTLLSDPSQAEEFLGDGRGVTMMIESYRNVVDLPSAQTAYREFFRELADPTRKGAALLHCTTGKDRTGWATASLLTALGADLETIYSDYLQTNTDLAPAIEPVLARAEQAGVNRSILTPVLGVRAEYLDTAFAQAAATYGSMQNYLRTGLQVTDEMEQALRERFVIP